MNSYVLAKLPTAQLEKLKKAGIPFFKWRNGGILLENEDVYQDAIAVLEAKVEENETADGLVFVTLIFENEVVAKPDTDERSRSRANYIRACATRIEQVVNAAREIFKQKKAALPNWEDKFVKATRKMRFAKTPERALKAQFEQELQALRALPKVRSVRVAEGLREIMVFTDTLYVTAPDTNLQHEIGQFLIRIHTDGTNDGVRFYNGTRRVNGVREQMNAPYIYRDGTVMTDEIKQTFVDLIARCEFASLVDLAIQYVETLNDDPAARSITSWPVAKFLPNSQES